MKTLYLDCGMGAAGDMLTAALLELVDDRDAFMSRLNALGVPGVRYRCERSVKCGIEGTHVAVEVKGVEEASLPYDGAELSEQERHYARHLDEHVHQHDHDRHDHGAAHDPTGHHHHDDGHHHDHAGHDHFGHRNMSDVRAIVEGLAVPREVKADVAAVYDLIAEAESSVHGVPVSEIHFHEVGALDAIADVAAVCLLMHELAPQQVIASPVNVGSGKVRCAHGVVPVPAPATAYLLKGIPIYSGSVSGELCTPTGAALLRHFVSSFEGMPPMCVDAIGYGMGEHDFEVANCLRAFLGKTRDGRGEVISLRCNVDDMTAEEIGFLMDRLYDCGALEVFTAPVGMKKSRPGTFIGVLCAEQDREKVVEAIFKHSTTIGVRESRCDRYVLDRAQAEVETRYGTVRRKDSRGYGVFQSKYEYDDLAKIARERGMSLREVLEDVEEDAGD